MLRIWQYWILLIMYILANATGLMVVGYASPMGQQLAHITTAQASAVVSILAISNTLGRFLGGAMSDRFGPFRVVIFLYLVNAATMFSMKLMTNFVLYALAVAILACSFGGMVGGLSLHCPGLLWQNLLFRELRSGLPGLRDRRAVVYPTGSDGEASGDDPGWHHSCRLQSVSV